MNIWHVTTRAAAESILEAGFEPNWGDAGLGVYFYDDYSEAEAYLGRGGWDGELDGELAIIEVRCAASDVEHVIPDPAWPNPEDYENVVWRPMEEDTVWAGDQMSLRFVGSRAQFSETELAAIKVEKLANDAAAREVLIRNGVTIDPRVEELRGSDPFG